MGHLPNDDMVFRSFVELPRLENQVTAMIIFAAPSIVGALCR